MSRAQHNYANKYSYFQNLKLHGYSDNYWAGFVDEMKSTSGFLFWIVFLKTHDPQRRKMWQLKVHQGQYYVAANAIVNHAIQINKILVDQQMKQNEPTLIHIDNQAALQFRMILLHGKTKYFSIKLYHSREKKRDGEIKLLYCNTDDQIADMLIKAQPKARFDTLRSELCLYNYQNQGSAKEMRLRLRLLQLLNNWLWAKSL